MHQDFSLYDLDTETRGIVNLYGKKHTGKTFWAEKVLQEKAFLNDSTFVFKFDFRTPIPMGNRLTFFGFSDFINILHAYCLGIKRIQNLFSHTSIEKIKDVSLYLSEFKRCLILLDGIDCHHYRNNKLDRDFLLFLDYFIFNYFNHYSNLTIFLISRKKLEIGGSPPLINHIKMPNIKLDNLKLFFLNHSLILGSDDFGVGLLEATGGNMSKLLYLAWIIDLKYPFLSDKPTVEKYFKYVLKDPDLKDYFDCICKSKMYHNLLRQELSY